MSETGITAQLAGFVVQSRWSDVPPAVRHEGERDVTVEMGGLALDVVLRTLFGVDAADEGRAGRVGAVLTDLMERIRRPA